MKEDQKLITIAEYDNSMDAELAKMTLENAGIESVIVGELAGVSLYHVFDPYVKVQVFEEDADRARKLLEGEFPPLDEEDFDFNQPDQPL
jgi:Zn-dependent membrane protease YugP